MPLRKMFPKRHQSFHTLHKFFSRQLSTWSMHKVARSDDKGVVLVATQNILPGTVVVEKERALLKYTETFLSKFSSKKPFNKAMATFSIFINDMSVEERKRVLSLYGPTSGNYADSFRSFCHQLPDLEQSFECKNVKEKVELMVKVGSVSRYNMFHSEDKYLLFETVSRMSHSCLPNCEIDIDGFSCTCRAILPVRAGEELTIEYNDELKLRYTFKRRRHYLSSKEFTCHCTRCDAPGDDTRQFDCCNPACNGVMMVCQPISNEAIDPSLAQYTGVTYIDPYLLPCTECGIDAPASYQKEMFALEEQLPKWSSQLECMLNNSRGDEARCLLDHINEIRLPRRHSATLPLMQIFCVLECNRISETHSSRTDQLERAVLEYIAAHESILRFPNATTCKEIVTMCTFCAQSLPAFPLAKELALKALRMHLLCHGRDYRDAHLDNLVGTLLLRDADTADRTGTNGEGCSQRCAFCGESPLRAALRLCRCSKCKKVFYCSAGCQKAHWRVHKQFCCQSSMKW